MSDQLPLAILTASINVPRITSTKRESTLNYYGLANASIAAEATNFLARLTDGVEQEMKHTIETFLRITQNDCTGNAEEKRACWLTIRLTKRSTEFEIPRWHQDGCMYPYDEGREEVVRSKYGLTLLGPSTLMLKSDESVYTTQREGEAQHYWWLGTAAHEPSEDEMDDADAKLREWLANKFKHTPRVQVGHGEVVRFSWGRDDSPVHSEPDLISDRVFMTVLYGSELELRRMCEWRNTQYGSFCEQ
ncbi:Ff.00g063730.m01.CDS01 [Fusarium sp. VM40]|nr:Ff.00g063730.m01.CDS01 [Fusarium sp. VM40]